LCVNARDAMPSGGALTLETKLQTGPAGATPRVGSFTDQTYVCLSVSDTGEGIPLAIQERIFQPFFSTKLPGEGSGLGLAMVASCVAGVGGVVAMDSRPGEGTRFDLYLPLAEADDAPPDGDARPLAEKACIA